MQICVNIWFWFSMSIMQKPTSSLLGSHLCCWAESCLSDSYFVANSQQLQLHQWANMLIDTNLAVQKRKIDGSNKNVSFLQASTSFTSELGQHRWNWVHAWEHLCWLSKADRSEMSFWACSAFSAILWCEGTCSDHCILRLAIPNCLLP